MTPKPAPFRKMLQIKSPKRRPEMRRVETILEDATPRKPIDPEATATIGIDFTTTGGRK